jgi:hypothetical protein
MPKGEFTKGLAKAIGNAAPHRVRVGGVSQAELLSKLAEAQIRLNPMAEQLLADPRFTTGPESSFVEVATVTVGRLGFSKGATFAQLAARATIQGLALCPLELAPYLRLQFTEQGEGSVGKPQTQHQAPPGSLTVASAPPSDEQNMPWGFYLRRIDGELWLRGYRSWSGHLWAPEDVLTFTRAQNAACGTMHM